MATAPAGSTAGAARARHAPQRHLGDAGLLAQLGRADGARPRSGPTPTTPAATGSRSRSSACTTACSPRPAAPGTTGAGSTATGSRADAPSTTRRGLHGGVRRRAARGAEGPADLPLPAALARGPRRPRRRAEGGAPAPPPARGRPLARPAATACRRTRRCCSGCATASRPSTTAAACRAASSATRISWPTGAPPPTGWRPSSASPGRCRPTPPRRRSRPS